MVEKLVKLKSVLLHLSIICAAVLLIMVASLKFVMFFAKFLATSLHNAPLKIFDGNPDSLLILSIRPLDLFQNCDTSSSCFFTRKAHQTHVAFIINKLPGAKKFPPEILLI